MRFLGTGWAQGAREEWADTASKAITMPTTCKLQNFGFGKVSLASASHMPQLRALMQNGQKWIDNQISSGARMSKDP